MKIAFAFLLPIVCLSISRKGIFSAKKALLRQCYLSNYKNRDSKAYRSLETNPMPSGVILGGRVH